MIESLRRMALQRFGRRVPVVLQAEMLECAHACLAMLMQHHGSAWTLEKMRSRFTPSSRGTSVSQTVKMAEALGLDARVFRAEPVHLSQLKLPCILHWDVVHFVVLERCHDGTYEVIDPAAGRITVSAGEFDRRFTGIVIEATPGLDFGQAVHASNRSALTLLKEGVVQRRAAIAAVIALAVVLELLALVSPLFIQTATDVVIPASDSDLLWMLVVAFAVSAVLQTCVALARSWTLLRLGEELTVGWNAAVCGRLLRLPYIFFMRRSVSDVHSRFASIEEIQRVVTNKFVEGVLDGATALLSLVIILAYSPKLAMLTFGFCVVYAVFRLLTLSRLLQGTERAIHARSAQQGQLLEILHGVHSIKANGYEANQLARYNRKTRDAAQATATTLRWGGMVDEMGQSILRLHWIAAVGAGAWLVMQGSITAGMLVAYVTYAYQFSIRSTRMLDLVAQWRTLRLHGERLADIVTGDCEPAGGDAMVEPGRYAFDVRSLRFRYNLDGPSVLQDVSFSISNGECIAITGASGSGKSTLAKVLVGLLAPDDGTICLGGKPLQELRREQLRDTIACVLQDDQLFNGTVAENIAFFEPGFSRERVQQAAKLAQIDGEIMAMPLRYDTRVIDLGASLSGGQRQRLILARALYRRPRILILDEASSHLDLENERLINQAIQSLSITRIIIAHRPQTIAIADRVLEMRQGTLHAWQSSDPHRIPA